MTSGRMDATGVIVTCAACGRPNRLAYDSLMKPARCGQCKATVTLPDAPMEIGDAATFDAASAGPLPLIVDFWAPWCAPCRMVAPELERVAHQARGQFLVVKVNTDALKDLAHRFRISSIPTMAIVHRGREIQRATGARPAADILAFARQSVDEDARRAS
jgi:thioredoxin 2